MLATLALAVVVAPAAAQSAERLADTWVDAIEDANRKHVRKPGRVTEDELAERLPRKARSALARLLEADPSDATSRELARCAEAALDLALVEDFARIRERLAETFPERATEVGVALARPRFLLRGMNGLDEAYLAHFAAVLELVLDGYDEVFGFEEWSKVPGKKLRVRVHLEEKIVRPPHFAPQFPYHSEIDFPVIDAEQLRSPTADGKFLFYGLCHELGHVIAMWGDRGVEEDHHAWAHYTGVVLVEHLAPSDAAALADVRDVRWRSLEKERRALDHVEPSLDDREGTLATLYWLHDRLGPRTIGAAINALDRKDRRRRINHVRYYTFAELGEALQGIVKNESDRDLVSELLR